MVEKQYRTIEWRFAALIVDGLLLVPLFLLADWLQGSAHSAIEAVVWALVPGWSLIVYRVLMHGRKGQTVGKMATRLKVVDLSGQSLSMVQAILRDIVPILNYVISSLYLLFTAESYWANLKASTPAMDPGWVTALGWAWMAWLGLDALAVFLNRRRRAIHDFIAGSVVVRHEPEAADAASERVRRIVVYAARVLLVLVGLAVILLFVRTCTGGGM
jgi:uncharacterized RDD family membrane protein YckC